MSDTIILPVSKKWFDMMRAGIKKEEYREIKKHYIERLFKRDKAVSINKIIEQLENPKEGFICDFLPYGLELKDFKKVEYRNGYGKSVPSITLELLDIVVATGVEEWGAVKGEFYFTLQLGKLLTDK